MLWCFGSAAVVTLLLGMAMLLVHPLSLLARLRPGALLRGCLVMMCLLVALGLGILGVLLAR